MCNYSLLLPHLSMSEAGLFIISYCDKVTNTVHTVTKMAAILSIKATFALE